MRVSGDLGTEVCIFNLVSGPVEFDVYDFLITVEDLVALKGTSFLAIIGTTKLELIDWTITSNPIHQWTKNLAVNSIKVDVKIGSQSIFLIGDNSVGGAGGFRIYDRASNTMIQTNNESFYEVKSVKFSRTGEYLGVSSDSGDLKIYREPIICDGSCLTCSGSTDQDCLTCNSPKILNRALAGACIECSSDQFFANIVEPTPVQTATFPVTHAPVQEIQIAVLVHLIMS